MNLAVRQTMAGWQSEWDDCFAPDDMSPPDVFDASYFGLLDHLKAELEL